jgi:hypothetical protein
MSAEFPGNGSTQADAPVTTTVSRLINPPSEASYAASSLSRTRGLLEVLIVRTRIASAPSTGWTAFGCGNSLPRMTSTAVSANAPKKILPSPAVALIVSNALFQRSVKLMGHTSGELRFAATSLQLYGF